MPLLIIFLIILIGSVWAGIALIRHPGYLSIMMHPWFIQMPLWFAILVLLITFLLFYFLISSLDRLQLAWLRFKNWRRFRHEQQLFTKTQQGLAALIEGRWAPAEKLLIASTRDAKEPLINYLGAAEAAHELQAYERRDKYIKKAYQVAPNASLAIGLTQAELELEQDKLEQASATLTHLKYLSPHHPQVLKLLEKVYIRLGDWQNLLLLLPNLRKAKLLTAEQREQFIKNIYCEILNASHAGSLTMLQDIWYEIPSRLKKNPDVVYAYIKQLQRFPNTNQEAESLIRKTLKREWHPALVHLYGQLPFDDINRQLVMVGHWMKTYGQKPELLLLLGKLCCRAKLWGKAKDYFERSLQRSASNEASLEYGKLLEQLGETELALAKYREGLIAALSKQCSIS